jgi:hypothetical protein
MGQHSAVRVPPTGAPAPTFIAGTYRLCPWRMTEKPHRACKIGGSRHIAPASGGAVTVGPNGVRPCHVPAEATGFDARLHSDG